MMSCEMGQIGSFSVCRAGHLEGVDRWLQIGNLLLPALSLVASVDIAGHQCT